ncbi:MAG: phosphate signaling complex protein PhoU [Alphaproteobacteria bacterium]|nr:phosphate signaling complex protein PhoU [Alphaproteobacteria bacterium]MBF0129903.1 phosphate signaling complex protein PhoU [Alphaproteobacteria bacterium]
MDQRAHTVKSYDEELGRLVNTIARMGGVAEAQLASAIQSVAKRDSELSERVISGDAKVDEFESEIHKQVMRLLALRQPVAVDLRNIVVALKISSDIERIADYAANVAKRAMILNQIPPVKPVVAISRMGRLAQELTRAVLDAYVERNLDKAIDVWKRDEEVDEMYGSLFRELITYMMEDPRNITACTHLMFIAKNIERIGDHATNIAESIHFLIKGAALVGARPKGDKVLGAGL